jgi:hypothetical protein
MATILLKVRPNLLHQQHLGLNLLRSRARQTGQTAPSLSGTLLEYSLLLFSARQTSKAKLAMAITLLKDRDNLQLLLFHTRSTVQTKSPIKIILLKDGLDLLQNQALLLHQPHTSMTQMLPSVKASVLSS